MLDSRILKCLMLTTSPHDAEALAAIRKANHLLADAKLCWMECFGQLEAPKQPEAGTCNWAAVIDAILCGTISQKWVDILSSIRDYYERYGRLSAKQEALVRKFMR